MKGYVLDYINENEFKKLERALKKYNMLAFKKLNFELGQNLNFNSKLIFSLKYLKRMNLGVLFKIIFPIIK